MVHAQSQDQGRRRVGVEGRSKGQIRATWKRRMSRVQAAAGATCAGRAGLMARLFSSTLRPLAATDTSTLLHSYEPWLSVLRQPDGQRLDPFFTNTLVAAFR